MRISDIVVCDGLEYVCKNSENDVLYLERCKSKKLGAIYPIEQIEREYRVIVMTFDHTKN